MDIIFDQVSRASDPILRERGRRRWFCRVKKRRHERSFRFMRSHALRSHRILRIMLGVGFLRSRSLGVVLEIRRVVLLPPTPMRSVWIRHTARHPPPARRPLVGYSRIFDASDLGASSMRRISLHLRRIGFRPIFDASDFVRSSMRRISLHLRRIGFRPIFDASNFVPSSMRRNSANFRPVGPSPIQKPTGRIFAEIRPVGSGSIFDASDLSASSTHRIWAHLRRVGFERIFDASDLGASSTHRIWRRIRRLGDDGRTTRRTAQQSDLLPPLFFAAPQHDNADLRPASTTATLWSRSKEEEYNNILLY